MKKVFKISLEISVPDCTNGVLFANCCENDLQYLGDERAKQGLTELLRANLPDCCQPSIEIEVENENYNQ